MDILRDAFTGPTGEKKHGLLAITKRLVLHPLRGIVELSEDNAFVWPYKLFTLAMATSLTLVWVIIPRIHYLVRGQALPTTNLSKLWQAVLIGELVLLPPVMFHVSKFFARNRSRTRRTYFKFLTILTAYVLVASSVIAVASDVLPIVLAWARAPFSSKQISEGAGIVAVFFPFVMAALAHRLFWNMRWLTLYFFGLALFLISSLIFALVLSPIVMFVGPHFGYKPAPG